MSDRVDFIDTFVIRLPLIRVDTRNYLYYLRPTYRGIGSAIHAAEVLTPNRRIYSIIFI